MDRPPSKEENVFQTDYIFASNAADFDPKLVSLFSNPHPRTRKPKAASRSIKGNTIKRIPFDQPLFLPDEQISASQHIQEPELGDVGYPSASQDSDPAHHITRDQRKRKYRDLPDDLEGKYLQRLINEEEDEDARRKEIWLGKHAKLDNSGEQEESAYGDDVRATEDENSLDERDSDDGNFEIPQHESLTPRHSVPEIEKSTRTVFLSNVSTAAIVSKADKKALLAHLGSFFPLLPPDNMQHDIESIRFRSVAFSSSLPKKAAFAKRELMDATTKSTNAYVVYSTVLAAREAAKRLNGTVVLGRHIRVDEVASPAQIDHRRCVFVGNLGYVDDESQVNAARNHDENRKSKSKPPSDIEEGLWQQFGKIGNVESVRVVRDSKTRVGKGFAYVQFTDENAVEAALLYNDKKFPPLLPRKLRVVRAKRLTNKNLEYAGRTSTSRTRTPRSRELHARVSRNVGDRNSTLLGRAGAANMRSSKSINIPGGQNGNKSRVPELLTFEGHRASSKQGNSGLRLGGARTKRKGKPKTRSARRGASWKAKVGGKAKK